MAREHKMPARAKRFILTKLIPFILREQGNGFAMSDWQCSVSKEDLPWDYNFDNCERTKLPACGTVACIGGSTAILLGNKRLHSVTSLGKALGLTEEQADGLFYRWETCYCEQPHSTAWPQAFKKRFEDAQGPLAKARVAVSLLKRVVKTDGKVLETGYPGYQGE